ncbi:MAG TPA: hypothetical protein DDZ88_00020 [Verrucomicrobiales bacterium]|nr:hypothetical protein [Verrucomicrobiales bacterium]
MKLAEQLLAFAVLLALLAQFRYVRSQRKQLERSIAGLKRTLVGMYSNGGMSSKAEEKKTREKEDQEELPECLKTGMIRNLWLKHGLRKVEMAEIAESLQDLTLIIPTHRRHPYLARALDFYRGWRLQIIVTDSSEETFREVFSRQVHYLHRPGVSFAKKLKEVIEMVRTPFVLLAADDDFISPVGVDRAIRYLQTHPECACAQGWHSAFSRIRPNRIKWLSIHLFVKKHAVDSRDPVSRVLFQSELYMNNFYALHRTPVLKDYFCRVCNELPENLLACRPDLLEIGQALTTVAWGHHVVLPGLWIAREMLADSAGARVLEPPPDDKSAEIFFAALADTLASRFPGSNPQEVFVSALVRYRRFQQRWNNLEIPHFGSIDKVISNSSDRAVMSSMMAAIQRHPFVG